MRHTFAGVLGALPRELALRFEDPDDGDRPLMLRISAPKQPGQSFRVEYVNAEDQRVQVVSIDAWADGDGGWDWNNIYTQTYIRLGPRVEDRDVIKALVDNNVLRPIALSAFDAGEVTVEDQQDILVVNEVVEVDPPEEDEGPQNPEMPIYALSWDMEDTEMFNPAVSAQDLRQLVAGEPLHDHFRGVWQTRSTSAVILPNEQDRATLMVWLDSLEEQGLS